MPTVTTDPIPTDARKLYSRVLAGWAGDSLRLRRDGLDRPCRREGAGLGVAPSPEPIFYQQARRAA